MSPIISICIPTYNEPGKIKTLLKSIQSQTFRDFEVIITDDSSNDLTQELLKFEFDSLSIRYYHNISPKGTPENWNYAISLAKGDWIKLMHHDDWFSNENTLDEFAKKAMEIDSDCNFIFSAYQNVFLHTNKQKKVFANFYDRFILKNFPLILFRKNLIGNPSCIMVRNMPGMLFYDNHLKWIVDFEYYIRILKQNRNFVYIPLSLINVGIHNTQVTVYSQLNPAVEIPEAIHFLKIHGISTLKNIYVYDYYWRLCRNLKIRSVNQFDQYLTESCNYPVILRIIKFQLKFPTSLLKIGMISKFLMTISFIKNYFS